MQIVHPRLRAVPLLITLYFTRYCSFLLVIVTKMACDEDLYPLECLICFRPQMTHHDLDEHAFEDHSNMWFRFHEDVEFMREFRTCSECEAVHVDYTFCDIGDVMYHIQVVHPHVKRDVSDRLIRYYWET